MEIKIVVEDVSACMKLFDFLKENDFYISDLQTTVIHSQEKSLSKELDENLLVEENLPTILNWVRRKPTDRLNPIQLEILEKLKATGVINNGFINWHENKLHEGATIDNLKVMGFKDFYEKFKYSYQYQGIRRHSNSNTDTNNIPEKPLKTYEDLF